MRILLLSLGLLALAPCSTYAGTGSLKQYIKPALKGLGALACMYGAYKAGQFVVRCNNVYLDPTLDEAIDLMLSGKVGGDVASIFATMFAGSKLFRLKELVLDAGTAGFGACISSGVLGAILAKSAYDDIKQNP